MMGRQGGKDVECGCDRQGKSVFVQFVVWLSGVSRSYFLTDVVPRELLVRTSRSFGFGQ